ncbi:late histone H1-like [Odontomachus brunneus]|uniref:late histone H1-like n=1 Tax=Odontomachus brunneus TaxID=486640 RepID=UPI0013F1C809|nr:late histone H1-like [Odontomachus brunneus]
MEDKNASGNTAAVENTAAGSPPTKKAAKSKAKTQRPKSSHPSTAKMVTTAIKELKDRKGSSVQAIKKYIASTYKVDGEKFAPFIKRYLKAAVTSGAVVQTKGKGASGSFKLAVVKSGTEDKEKRGTKKLAAKKAAPKKKAVVAKKAPAEKKPAAAKKTQAEKKPAAQKKTAKTAAAKKVEAAAKQKAAAQVKSLSKTKKATKAPAAKTKTPKPKTAKAAPKTAKAAKK